MAINFDNLQTYQTPYGKFFDDRLVCVLEKLDDNEPITLRELATLLQKSTNYILYLIRRSGRDYKNGIYPIDVNSLFFKTKIARGYIIQKKNIAEFFKYLQHKQCLTEIRKHKQAYKKAMKKKYGLDTFATSSCAKAGYNCAVCYNKEICEIYNNKNFTRKITQILKVLNVLDDGRVFYKTREKEIELKKQLEEKIKKINNENLELKIRIKELETLLLKAKKELIKISECEGNDEN